MIGGTFVPLGVCHGSSNNCAIVMVYVSNLTVVGFVADAVGISGDTIAFFGEIQNII